MAAATLLVVTMARSDGTRSAEGAHRVVLLEPASRNEFELEVLARVRGELGAAGFAVSAVTTPDTGDARATVENAARDLAPAAVLMIQARNDRQGPAQTVDLWLSDWGLRRTLVQELSAEHADPSRRAAQLAVMAVEALRAHFAEFAIVPESPPPPPKPSAPEPPKPNIAPPALEPARPEPPSTEPSPSDHFEIGVAVGVLHGFRGIGPVAVPIVRGGWILPKPSESSMVSFELRAGASAFGKSADVSSGIGSARVQQSFATLEAAIRFFPDAPVQPFFSLGGGAYTVSIEGNAPSPYLVQTSRTWSAIATAGAGAWVRPVKRLAWMLEAQLLTAASRTVVRIDEVEAAEAGAPAIALSTGIAGVF